jgi:hypothetical protein
VPIQLSDPIRRSQVRDGPPRAGAGGDVAELQGWGAGVIVACFFFLGSASDRREDSRRVPVRGAGGNPVKWIFLAARPPPSVNSVKARSYTKGCFIYSSPAATTAQRRRALAHCLGAVGTAAPPPPSGPPTGHGTGSRGPPCHHAQQRGGFGGYSSRWRLALPLAGARGPKPPPGGSTPAVPGPG